MASNTTSYRNLSELSGILLHSVSKNRNFTDNKYLFFRNNFLTIFYHAFATAEFQNFMSMTQLFLQSYHHHATIRPNDDDWSSDKPSSDYSVVYSAWSFACAILSERSSGSIHHPAKMSKKLQLAPLFLYPTSKSFIFGFRLLQTQAARFN